mmetsp:Transcript_25378/g.37432  ORF Transcript_25378/g.37432 Transcript_25378/m.37432 type:complete len:103 (-) Transcript_25378:487-795(-)
MIVEMEAMILTVAGMKQTWYAMAIVVLERVVKMGAVLRSAAVGSAVQAMRYAVVPPAARRAIVTAIILVVQVILSTAGIRNVLKSVILWYSVKTHSPLASAT